MAIARVPLPLSTIALAVGCADPTAVRVTVYSEVPCETGAEVGVTVADAPQALPTALQVAVATQCEPAESGSVRRGSVVISPHGDKEKSLAFQVATRNDRTPTEICSSNVAGCIAARRSLRFQSKKTIEVRVDLRLSCLGVVCPLDQTCVAGQCVTADLGDCQTCGEPPAPPNTNVIRDAGAIPDAGPGPADAAVPAVPCGPVDVAGFVAPPYVPATATHALQCVPPMYDDFWNTCYGGPDAGAAACANFGATPANATCADCLQSPVSAPAYGPVVRRTGGQELNVAGCIERAVPGASGLSCAKTIQAAQVCTETACARCPTVDAPSTATYRACLDQAATGGCATLSNAATSCVNQLAADAVDAGTPDIIRCTPGGTPQERFIKFGFFFCGS